MVVQLIIGELKGVFGEYQDPDPVCRGMVALGRHETWPYGRAWKALIPGSCRSGILTRFHRLLDFPSLEGRVNKGEHEVRPYTSFGKRDVSSRQALPRFPQQ